MTEDFTGSAARHAKPKDGTGYIFSSPDGSSQPWPLRVSIPDSPKLEGAPEGGGKTSIQGSFITEKKRLSKAKAMATAMCVPVSEAKGAKRGPSILGKRGSIIKLKGLFLDGYPWQSHVGEAGRDSPCSQTEKQ